SIGFRKLLAQCLALQGIARCRDLRLQSAALPIQAGDDGVELFHDRVALGVAVRSHAAVLVVLLVAFVLGPPPTAARRAVTLVVLVRWHGLVELEDLLRPLCDSLVKNGD